MAIPDQTYFKIYGPQKGIALNFIAASHDQLDQAQDEVRVLIRSHRHLRPEQDDNFFDRLFGHLGFRIRIS